VKFAIPISMVDLGYYSPMAQAAEAAGFDVILLSDSICYPKVSDSTYPYNADGTREFLENKPFPETMLAMAAMGAVTERIHFCPFVLKMPVRHPVILAKQATALAVMTGNRIQLGVGTSPWPDDYQVMGVPWEGRGKRFEECIEIVRGLAAGGYFEYHGRFYDFPPIKLNPTPTEPIPILIGGHGDINIRRTGRMADGWMSATFLPDEQLSEIITRLHDLRREHGRTGAFSIYATSMDSFTPDGIRRLEDMGVTHTMGGLSRFNPYGVEADHESLQDKIDAINRYADEVITKVG
jgi:alkanesulfonate monooxygenase SsuD/methylene tetrahydromethanopterin reductase-like flavin-dependent oxidoreductase (luciferase family)